MPVKLTVIPAPPVTSNSTEADEHIVHGAMSLTKPASCRCESFIDALNWSRERFQSPFNYKPPSASIHSPSLAKYFSGNIQV